MASTVAPCAISVVRNADRWQLTLHDWRSELRDTVKKMPYVAYDGETRTWSAPITVQSLAVLRQLRWQGAVDPDPDLLIAPAETFPEARSALVRPGSSGRPFVVHMACRDDRVYRKLNAIPGASWSKQHQAMTYPAHAALGLLRLVDDGTLDDPQQLLADDGTVTVFFDTYTGNFVVRGDPRAARWFDDKFPARDVMDIWTERGLAVKFADEFTEEIYRGELARLGDGIQPEGLNAQLHLLQRRDTAVILERSGTGLFSSMGAGKTVVTIAAGYELAINRGTVPRCVIVVPPALRTQWRGEISRFTGTPEDDIVVIDGTPKKRAAQWEAAYDAKWVVVHYNAATLKDGKEHLPKLVSGAFLAADEVHRLKDHTTATTKQMQQLARRAACRVGMSGTPVENKPSEWFTILSGFVYPGVFGSALEFLNTYSYPGPHGGFEGARALPQLRERSKKLYVRHTLDEVAPHLPKMRVQTVVLEPDAKHAAALKRLHREARREIANERIERVSKTRRGAAAVLDGYDREDLAKGADMTATSMLKLACCSPRLLHMSDAPAAVALVAAGLVPDVDGPKIDMARTLAAEFQANGDRVVMFATSKKLIGLLAERLASDGIRYVTYTGDTTRPERDAAQAAFTTPATDDDPGPTVFLGTDAGAEGLNLGRCCSTVVNLDVAWTPGRFGQRNGRVRRLDSTATSFLAINLVLAGTVEGGFLKMVEHKSDLADAVFGEGGGRARITGRDGRNVFETALEQWDTGADHGAVDPDSFAVEAA